MKIKKDVLDDILLSIYSAPPEHGGIIGGRNDIISVFEYDTVGSSKMNVYVPDVIKINAIIEEWYRDDILFYGIVHSHPQNEPTLSGGDIQYIKTVMEKMEIGEKLYFPIVIQGIIIPYVSIRSKTSITIEQEELNAIFR